MRNCTFLSRAQKVSGAIVLAGLGSVSPVLAQGTLGEVSAASGASNSMSASGSSGTMAVGSRAAQDARRLGSGYSAYGAGGPNAPSGPPPPSGSSDLPASGSSEGGPNFPNPSGEGGAGATAVATPPPPEALHWGKETGEDYLRELLQRATAGRGTGRNIGGGSRVSNKTLSRLPAKTRSKIINRRYKKPPVGYLSYYLPQDRYKMTSGVWKYVTIEDDRARYPVRHYYRPDSAVFLRILATRPRNSQPRYNRVIGFNTWQDAMVAGYRPDPVSKPSPGIELAYIARISPRAPLARYTEFVYAGQVKPQVFARNYAYIRRVQGIVNARPDTRKYLKPTIGQILLAATGAGQVPRQVGEIRTVTTTTTQSREAGAPPNLGGAGFGSDSGSSPSGGMGSSDPRADANASR